MSAGFDLLWSAVSAQGGRCLGADPARQGPSTPVPTSVRFCGAEAHFVAVPAPSCGQAHLMGRLILLVGACRRARQARRGCLARRRR